MEKKNSDNIITLIIVSIAILTGIVIYIAYNNEFIFGEKNETVEDRNDYETEENITSLSVQEELSQKINILELIDMNNVTTKNSWYPADIYYIDKIKVSNLNKKESLYALLKYYYNSQQFSNLTTTYDFSGIYSESDRWQDTFRQIDANYILEKYNELYGSSYSDSISETFGICPMMIYDNENQKFYGYSECGGINLFSVISYINRYMQSDDAAYVYVSVGSTDYDSGYIYKDYNSTQVYTTLKESDTIDNIITSENYQDFSEYKYTFKKNEDDSYSFKSIERIR